MSVVIPAYNEEWRIAKCLDSVDGRISSRSIRTSITRAARNKVAVRRLESPDIAMYYKLFMMSKRQHLKPPFPASFFEETIGALKAEGVADIWVAEVPSGESMAANIMVWDSRKAYGWLGA